MALLVVAPWVAGLERAIKDLEQICSVPEEIQRLITTMIRVKALLKDAEEKKITDLAVRDWLEAVKRVVLDAEDLVDGISTAVRSMGARGRNKVFSCPVEEITRAVRRQICQIADELDQLSRLQPMLGLQTSTLEECRPEAPRGRPIGSFLRDETFVVGRDREKLEIIQLLLSPTHSSDTNFSVHAIVASGGMGKRTLARLVFDDERVKKHFDLMMWVHVSENEDPRLLHREMLEAALDFRGKPANYDVTDYDSMQRRLVREVEGKIFLLVLVGSCMRHRSAWREVCKALHFGKKGSRVLVTTPNQKIASLMSIGWHNCIRLRGLSDADSWDVFKRYAFNGFIDADVTISTQYSHLEHIGRGIVPRLRGSPLSARTLGSLLNTKLDEQYWETVLESESWNWVHGTISVLRLSYKYLDGVLKQCFTYCSLFPKGYKFDREDVVQQWEAQCFIRTDRGTRTDMSGGGYFDHLLRLSFFESNVTCYVMHNLMNDLAEFASQGDCFRLDHEMPDWENLETVRHISVRLSMWNPATLGVGICRYEKLRTLLFLPRFEIHGLSIFVLRDLFSKLKLLRVLGLRHCEIKEVPESIGDMKHLRYLDLSGNPLLRHLPESLGDLYNLQTLKVEGCGSLRALPARTSELTNLRHLQADDELVSDIDGLGKLTNLEELSVRGRKVRELGGMSMLRKLSIWNLEEVESKEEVLQIRLKRMECLEVLRLEWSAQRQRGPMPMNSEVAAVEEEEGVLQALQPNGNSIQELRIWGYMGARSPNWMEAPTVGSFSGLRYVVVGCCPNWKALPSSLSQLPVLESLVITSMPRWEEWDGDHSNSHQDPCSDTPYFPCLRELQIVDCPKLGELLLLPPKLRNLRLEKVGLSHLPGLRGHRRSGGETEAASSSSTNAELSSLLIRSCRNLISVTGLLQHQLPALKEVVIEMCQQLVSFPERGFGHLSVLKKLWIVRCPRIQWPPPARELELEGYLPLSLKELKIQWCGDAMGWWWRAGLRQIGTLTNLSLRGCPCAVSKHVSFD